MPHANRDSPDAARRTREDGEPRVVVVSGSSGLIGSELVRRLQRRGDRVRRLVRSVEDRDVGDILWDPASGELDPVELRGVDAVIHLAGEPVGERWSSGKKRRIRQSRVDGTATLARALAAVEPRPEVLVSASAIGIYGSRGAEILTEGSAPGRDFLAEVARDWEAAARPAADAGIRLAHPRFGVVLSPNGGALEQLLTPFRMGLGGKAGNGRQWVSWVALDDAVRAICFLLDTPELEGAFNVVAPNPVTNAELAETLGQVLGRPSFATVPAAVLRLTFGEMADATLLASQRVLPERLLEAGFRFEHPTLEEALRHELEG